VVRLGNPLCWLCRWRAGHARTYHLIKLQIVTLSPRQFLKRILPASWIDVYRRKRLLRQHLSALSQELLTRRRVELGTRAERAASGLAERPQPQSLERTELVLEQLHRQIEALSARYGSELRELRAEVAALASVVEELRASTQPLASASREGPMDSNTPTPGAEF
jgi:hypothetical protein